MTHPIEEETVDAPTPPKTRDMGAAPLSVVFGAGGPVGNTLVSRLAARGERVRAVNRSGRAAVPAGVERVRADATDPGRAREACRGAAVVYHTACPPYPQWRHGLAPIMAGIIDAAAHAGAELVYADNLYAYGPVDGPLTEDLPLAAEGPKGLARAEASRMLIEAHHRGDVRATIGRSSDFYGPGVTLSAVGAQVFGRALAGKPAQLIGDVDTLHTYTYVEDFADGLLTLAGEPQALGRAWHIPSAEPVTTRQLVTWVFEQLDREPRISVAPRWLLRLLGLFRPMMRELQETAYQFERPFVMDTSRFEERFPADPTPHREAIARTLQWYREREASAEGETAPVAREA